LRNDGTRPLLVTGASLVFSGAVCFTLARTAFGGVDRHGPHTDAGWLALIAGLMTMPLGLLLLALGVAKWFGGRRD
jgi:hypothetical protein